MRWAGFVLAIAIGCAEAPDAPFDRSGIDVRIAGENVSAVIGPSFEMQFADEGVRLPSQLTVDSTPLLASGSCPRESLVGTNLYPFANMVARHPAMQSRAIIEPTFEVAGPAVAQVLVSYDVPIACNDDGGSAVMQHMNGEALFTLFPSGRIVRNDTVAPSEPLDAGASCTQCGGDPIDLRDVHFSAFWSFAATAVVDETGTALPLGGGDAYARTCVIGANGRLVGVEWATDHGGSIELNDNAGQTLAYQWLDGASSVTEEPRTAYSQIVISDRTDPADCDDVLAQMFDAPLRRTSDGKVLENFNGVNNAEQYPGAPIVLEALARMPHGFAIGIEVDLEQFDHVKVRRNGEPVTFIFQPSVGGCVLWVDDGLEQGDELSIEME